MEPCASFVDGGAAVSLLPGGYCIVPEGSVGSERHPGENAHRKWALAFPDDNNVGGNGSGRPVFACCVTIFLEEEDGLADHGLVAPPIIEFLEERSMTEDRRIFGALWAGFSWSRHGL